MRPLEKVIHNKFVVCKGVNKSYSIRERLIQKIVGKPVYTIDNMKIDNIVELMEIFTPLICYIMTLLKQEQENINKHVRMKLEFPISDVSIELDDVFKVNDDNV